ncbi:MAG: gliding motility-associated protein GldE [Bacteroidota bacterium]
MLFFLSLSTAPASGLVAAAILVLFLLLCSALISSSEIAFFSLSPNDLRDLEEENSRASLRILQLRENSRRLLATILISNNFINIAIVILSDFLLRNLLPPGLMESWAQFLIDNAGLGYFFSLEKLASSLNFLISVAGVTFLLVLFGEVAPKVYARFNNMKLAKLMSFPLAILASIFNPLSKLLVKGTNAVEERLVLSTQNGTLTSREDIDQAIELTVKGEEHGQQDIDILKGIVKFGDVSAKQIMRSRVDVIALDFRTDYKELLKVVRESGFSRIPVYDGDFDSVTGVLYVKDLLPHLQEPETFEWQELIRPNVLYVPEAKKINDLLREFQTERLHMAIVVDEYGGSSGIVTLEDIMEEVIGEIRDEFDDEIELEYIKIDDCNYVFEGKTLLNDVCRVVGLDTSVFDEVRGDADSVAGLVLELAGQIPRVDTEISYNQYKFKTVAVSKRRIEQIQITLPPK